MKIATLVLAVVAAALLTSDILHGAAMRQWRDGNAVSGMNLINHAGRINPFSFNVKLDQIESLYTGYRRTRDIRYLDEIVLISRDMTRLYPGSVRAWGMYSSAAIFYATHGGDRWPVYPIEFALHAADMDPLSVPMIERAMFLISAKRRDYETFKQIGIKRSRLTTERLTMICELCGKHWLDHRGKSK